ncbi:SGNH/GDSL hydrolase family protein [Pedobacter sp. ASV28]|uniref:SGNH/GDSL hydrolase family protein n=1 Tax=Pedobacter sp. ASV28 TaxID=2795123 RepID=UPI0018EDC970|nr:SGNH/GDSL hydrolase family protein [Pedobacter sp. ASV28]
MKKLLWLLFTLLCAGHTFAGQTRFYKANHTYIQYTGRVDYGNPMKPKFWASGAYVQFIFKGSYCAVQLNDEMLWGNVLNYLEIKIDDQPAYRIRLTGKENHVVLAKNLPKGNHTVLICKNSEAENGYVEMVGVTCEELVKPMAKPKRKIEFIGDSITCGAGSDESEVKCGTKGSSWHDQHNAYFAYGPTTARALKAQWHLSSVSGIGLMHSCCGKKIVMPPVFDKINLAGDTVKWDFSRYQPDVVTICLGQNDGIQDSVKFTSAYIGFVKELRGYYPQAKLILLSSPMASDELKAALIRYINAVTTSLRQSGEKNIGSCFFSRKSFKGCGGHPSLAEHEQIAEELTAYLKKSMKW